MIKNTVTKCAITKKVTDDQTNRIKSSVQGYKTLASRVDQLKSSSYTNKQNQCNYKMIQNSAFNNKLTKR